MAVKAENSTTRVSGGISREREAYTENAENGLEIEAWDDNELSDESREFLEIVGTGFRWEVAGTGSGRNKGKYREAYYCWRRGSGKSREYRKGGKLTESREWLEQYFPRPGKGNRKPKSRKRPDADSAAVNVEPAKSRD